MKKEINQNSCWPGLKTASRTQKEKLIKELDAGQPADEPLKPTCGCDETGLDKGCTKHKGQPIKKPTSPPKKLTPLHRLENLSEYCRTRSLGWKFGNVNKRIKRAQYRAFKQAAQIVRDAKGGKK